MFSHSFDPNLVRPLAAAENQFLQVLVDKFRILRKGQGYELQVGFSDDSPAIWTRAAKRHILATLPVERRTGLQQSIDAFFRSNDEVYEYHDPSFPFRLGNGGTLPIVRLQGADYYCLFYRDSYPTGWNIANGGANTRQDLLHPDLIVERELREELIIVEPRQRRWYVFDWHDARLRDHPDFAVAQMLWVEKFRRQKFDDLQDIPLPLKWSLPPDADRSAVEQRHHDVVRIHCGHELPIYTGQGFLNINAADFGIEFDRIAKLSVGSEAVFCDGELRGDQLLNRVVGLFAVNRMQELVAADARHFVPDRIFWDGVDRTGDNPQQVIEAYLHRRGASWGQLEENMRNDATPAAPGDPLDLCPVTRTIIQRHSRLNVADQSAPPAAATTHKIPATPITPPTSPLPIDGPFEVFVSFASEDRELARSVYDHITACNRRAFFSDVSMTNGGFADQIDVALDSAVAFVVVGTRAEHLQKSWVKYEWRNFSNDLYSGLKPTNAPFFAFVSGMSPKDLPRPLRLQQAVVNDPKNPALAFDKLTQFIGKL